MKKNNAFERAVIFLVLLTMLLFLNACGSDSQETEATEMVALTWTENVFAEKVPVPKTTVGYINNNNKWMFEVYLSDFTLDDFNTYVDECVEMGYTVEVNRQERFFYAQTKDYIEVKIEHQDNDIMHIAISEVEYDVEIKVINMSESSARYDVEIEVDGYYEEELESGDMVAAFDTYLNVGTHELRVINTKDDDIYGTVIFEITSDDYLEFEINCTDIEVEISPRGESKQTDNSKEKQNESIGDQDFEDGPDNYKMPTIEDDSFNLTDREFIDWINATSDMHVEYTEIGLNSDVNTGYKITMSDGDTGVLIFNHGDGGTFNTDDIKKGKVRGIMTTFDEKSTSLSVVIWMGHQIDSTFLVDDAIEKLVKGDAYSKAAMTAMYLEDSEVAILSPTMYIAKILE